MKFDWTNAERQKRHRAKKREKALLAKSNTSNTQLIEKPKEVTPRNTSPHIININPSDSTLPIQRDLFPLPRAREEFTLIPDDMELTQPRLEVALVAGMAGDEAGFTFMDFKAYWQARDRTARNWDAMWVSWCLEWRRRNQRRFELGTVGNAEREKRQVETVLGAMANGTQRSGNSECVRAAVAGVFSARSGHQLQNMGAGNGNVVFGTFRPGMPGRDNGANPNLQAPTLNSSRGGTTRQK